MVAIGALCIPACPAAEPRPDPAGIGDMAVV
jgi:hypothetical protein